MMLSPYGYKNRNRDNIIFYHYYRHMTGTLFSRDSIWNLKWSIWEWLVGTQISPNPTKTSKEYYETFGTFMG